MPRCSRDSDVGDAARGAIGSKSWSVKGGTPACGRLRQVWFFGGSCSSLLGRLVHVVRDAFGLEVVERAASIKTWSISSPFAAGRIGVQASAFLPILNWSAQSHQGFEVVWVFALSARGVGVVNEQPRTISGCGRRATSRQGMAACHAA